MTLNQMQQLASALDACRDLLGSALDSERRARIFNAFESPTAENWQDARTILITPTATLWQAAVAAGVLTADPSEVPSPDDILTAVSTVLHLAQTTA